jgi:hypothetical protein
VPAAAVIPAPRAYINVVAVKKPVVGFEQFACAFGPTWIRLWRVVRTISEVLRHAGTSTG